LINTLPKKLRDAIKHGEQSLAEGLAKEITQKGYDINDVIRDVLTPALQEVGRAFENREIFLPDMMYAAEAMKAAMKIFEPTLLINQQKAYNYKATIVLGTIKGDIHDIGKNIVSTMLQIDGFNVIDIGVDVPPLEFIKAAKENRADIIAISALLSTTQSNVEDLIQILEEIELREQYKILVGGGCVTKEWAEGIGADGYGLNVNEALNAANRVISG
jgi:trimethylamine corrinoid protein